MKLFSSYFIIQGFKIKEKIRNRVRFSKLDLFEISSFEPCDLIMCRNVLIYVDRNAQSTILRTFYKQLKYGGYLVIGKVELLIGIPEAKLFEVVSRDVHVYRKKDVMGVSVYEASDGQVFIATMNLGVMSKMFGGIIKEVMGDAAKKLKKTLANIIEH